MSRLSLHGQAASSPILVPFLDGLDHLPCHAHISKALAQAASSDEMPRLDTVKLKARTSYKPMALERRHAHICQTWYYMLYGNYTIIHIIHVMIRNV